jgi:glutaredoxin 3
LRVAFEVPPIVIYTKTFCPYCDAAKALLKAKGAAFEEVSVDGDRAGQLAMAGGCDDLHDLDAAGELDGLLADAP